VRKKIHQQTDNLEVLSTTGIIDTALQIANERRRILKEMRVALLSQDDEELRKLASKLCGLEND